MQETFRIPHPGGWAGAAYSGCPCLADGQRTAATANDARIKTRHESAQALTVGHWFSREVIVSERWTITPVRSLPARLLCSARH